MSGFFLYARKSTDTEEKQVLSIEAQLCELRLFAQKENLTIKEELIEKMSAKTPGRPIFNQMIERIERGEAQGILAWHPDRLARNSVDGGRVIYLLDSQKLQYLKFPTFWFDNTPQGKFMMSIAFGQSKYWYDRACQYVYVSSFFVNWVRLLERLVPRARYMSTVDHTGIRVLRKTFGSAVTHDRCSPGAASIYIRACGSAVHKILVRVLLAVPSPLASDLPR